ncbi:MAG: ABC transporter ATP-binding protein [Alphaproteobacteria bacterium]|jgi:peptide/nickel transport system ATP-binding protein|nr:ABC transporter ATP-binding protein [Alphaproteobacteria bacterium]
MIEIEGFSLSYQDVTAVHALSLNVARGEALGLVGESGCGKTTVLRAVAGLAADWSGRIAIDGAERDARRPRMLPRTLQMVFQDPYGSLNPRQRVAECLGEPLAIQGIDDRQPRVMEALAQVGLEADFAARYPNQLSGGQRQRVAIARALMLEPPLLLLDEPTSALDMAIQAEILSLLARLRSERGLTYLLVSHDLAVVAELCESVAVMRGGRLVECVTTDVLRSGNGLAPYTKALLAASRGEAVD